ncbi:TonB-dependent receptor [uncultured Pseudomonas sp.]|uniref:TonB-dependent receptor plug domain-containing protein n=1 Tax=uncultured Pseudomonas sp. TaxID=114707 RepID=UPI00260A70DB|nr:TonB-dependent receptor [uncultured Pseudomonas sp.]
MLAFEYRPSVCVANPTSLASLIGALALLAPALVAAEDLFEQGQALPEILSATRLKQSPAAVPGSVSVIDRALIDASGARDIPELMRLVPGMMVGYVKGNEMTVNYHGGQVGSARRLQVLIDGRSVYRPGLATVDWSDLPLAMEDIERIEVFRGPNTVSYGANALTGVISITTRNPANSHGTRLKYIHGQRGIDDWYGSQGFSSGNGDFRLSLSGQQDSGFDHTDKDQPYRDSRRSTRMQFSASHTLDDSQTLDWQLAAKEGSNQKNFYSDEEALVRGIVPNGDSNKDIKARDFSGSVRWSLDTSSTHNLQLQAYAQRWERTQEWRTCDLALSFTPEVAALQKLDPDMLDTVSRLLRQGKKIPASAGPLAVAIGNNFYANGGALQAPVCGDINNNINESRYDFELQDTLSLSDDLRLLSGMNYRKDSSDSQSYFQGSLSNEIWRLFGHLEWHLSEHFVLQGGVMHEDDTLSGSSLTSRIALNYLITPRHGLRFVYSEAIRSPDMQENNVNWSYLMENLSPTLNGRDSAYYYATAQGPGNLQQEIMRSREIGYNGQFDFGLQVDIKLFNDEIHRMIAEPLKIKEFLQDNNNYMWLRGAETEVDWTFTSSDRLRLTYAYVDFETSEKSYRRLTARYSGSAGWLHEWGGGWSSSLFYYGADLLNERRFERADLRVAKRFNLGKSDLELALMVQQRLDDEALTWRENLYDERRLVYVSAQLDF